MTTFTKRFGQEKGPEYEEGIDSVDDSGGRGGAEWLHV
jgi:hypothetical protein